MTPQPANVQAVSEIYELLHLAAARRQPVAAVYEGLPRLLCPHVLGRKSGRLHVFFYQFGGSSSSGLPITPDGVGGISALARGQRIQDDRRGQRGKNGSARPPGTHKLRCTVWRDDGTRASCDPQSVPTPTLVSTPRNRVR